MSDPTFPISLFDFNGAPGAEIFTTTCTKLELINDHGQTYTPVCFFIEGKKERVLFQYESLVTEKDENGKMMRISYWKYIGNCNGQIYWAIINNE